MASAESDKTLEAADLTGNCAPVYKPAPDPTVKIEGECFSAWSGSPGEAPTVIPKDPGAVKGLINNGWIKFSGIDFGQLDQYNVLEVHYSKSTQNNDLGVNLYFSLDAPPFDKDVFPDGNAFSGDIRLETTQTSLASTEAGNVYKTTFGAIETSAKVSGVHDLYLRGNFSSMEDGETRIDYLKLRHDDFGKPVTPTIPDSQNNPLTDDRYLFTGENGKALWSGGCASPEDTKVTVSDVDRSRASERWRVRPTTGGAVSETSKVIMQTDCQLAPGERVQVLTANADDTLTTKELLINADTKSQEWIVIGENGKVKLRSSIDPYKYLDYDDNGNVVLTDTGKEWSYEVLPLNVKY